MTLLHLRTLIYHWLWKVTFHFICSSIWFRNNKLFYTLNILSRVCFCFVFVTDFFVLSHFPVHFEKVLEFFPHKSIIPFVPVLILHFFISNMHFNFSIIFKFSFFSYLAYFSFIFSLKSIMISFFVCLC